VLRFTVGVAEDRARLDKFVAARTGCSRLEAQRLIAAGHVRVDGKRGKKGTPLQTGAVVELTEAPPTDEDKRPQPDPAAPLNILYLDDAVIALAKPPGAPTHPLRPGERGTLANALVARFPECAAISDDPREGGVAHRLDIDTSGVVLAARTRPDWLALRRAFQAGEVDKEYWALVMGDPPPAGEIDVPLAHAGDPRMVKPIDEWSNQSARPARTRFEVMARGPGRALVRARSMTGQMHQIRAHLAHLGHPLYGDALYGGPPAPAGAPGHFLHAARIAFPHPRSGATTVVHAPLPPERAKILAQLVDWSED
jgi:23S rRNA pseudouridine1911/1915/1917 synthase